MKKRVTSVLVAVMLSLAAILSLTGCSSITQKIKDGGSGSSKDGGTQSAAEILQEEPLVTEAEDDGKYHIGILTYRRHGASEETVEGFEEEMRSLLGSEKVVFEEVDADGDAQKCAEIATGFANSGYQLIFACGTEAVQNAGAAVNNIPIIGGCVSDYLLSSVVSSLDAPGGNITGVSSLGPIQEQMDLIERITPWPASVAIVSSGTETGSRFEAEVATQILDEKGISWKSFHAATEEDLRLQMKEAAENYSCIYLPTDNFVASHMDIVRDVVLDTGVLTVTGDYQMCADGGLCCCSIDYHEHGRKAAGMAYAVLEQDEEISRMAIQDETESQLFYNPVIAERIGFYDFGDMAPLNVSEEDFPEAAQPDEGAQSDESAEQ
ncbi:MAG: ABC transporter substrate-binding protein [Lachnospiraceae bacterium]|nr:ABC transporter substrate-binding protein [Lachnospiraceae bacterium]